MILRTVEFQPGSYGELLVSYRRFDLLLPTVSHHPLYIQSTFVEMGGKKVS